MFPKLDTGTISIRGYADAGFGSNEDLTSQLSTVIVLTDNDNNAIIIHYVSWKSRRVVRSPLAAEVYALSACHDYCMALAHHISTMIGKKIPVYLMTDSKSIFDTITKLSNVSEKRLTIDIASLRESYGSGEISNIGHALTKYNLSNPLTKKMNSKILEN